MPVVDDLDRLDSPPDIIHGQHTDETVTALLRFPNDARRVRLPRYRPWTRQPPFPSVCVAWAWTPACRDKLVFEHGVPEERVSVLLQS